jgi:hypothetical protein
MKVRRTVWAHFSFVALVVLIGILLWRFGHIGIVPAFATSFAAVLANGLLATLEDDLPGGFNNRDGTSTPRYAQIVARITRLAFLALCALLAAFLFLSAAGIGFTTSRGLGLACLGLAVPIAYLAVTTHRRVALVALIAMVGLGILLASWGHRGV